MGGAISGLLGTNSAVGVDSTSAQGAINPYIQQQNQLATQLQQVANGTGPNPAQKQLFENAQQTGAQAASTLAGQRGLNTGLAARTAAQNQVASQQQAAGQAATLGAQQQISAQGQLANLYGQQENATNQAGAINAGIAGANQQQAAGITGGLLGAGGAALGLASGGVVPRRNFADGGPLQGQVLQVTPAASAGPQSSFGQSLNGSQPMKNGVQGVMSGLMKKMGGAGQAVGGNLSPTTVGDLNAEQNLSNANDGPVDLSTGFNTAAPDSLSSSGGMGSAGNIGPALSAASFARGGKVPAMVSPGEGYLPPAKAQAAAKGKIDPIKASEKIPGQAKVSGDSLKNDTVPKTLEEGGLVLPRSVMQAKHPGWAARAFVHAHLGLTPSTKKK